MGPALHCMRLWADVTGRYEWLAVVHALCGEAVLCTSTGPDVDDMRSSNCRKRTSVLLAVEVLPMILYASGN